MEEINDFFIFDAYCCGQKMCKKYLENGYIKYKCVNSLHKNFFIISIDPKKPSYCSCNSGTSLMQTKDFENFRIYYGCSYCGAIYNITKSDTQKKEYIKEDKLQNERIIKMTQIQEREKLLFEILNILLESPRISISAFIEKIKVDNEKLFSILEIIDSEGYARNIKFTRGGMGNKILFVYYEFTIVTDKGIQFLKEYMSQSSKNNDEESSYYKDKLTVFISYSWDSDEHRKRVRDFVLRLRSDDIGVVYDDDMELGDRITTFMEKSVTDCNKVIYVCTPIYKQKADKRTGGVGYENTIITGELYETQNERKFIPVLFSGSWSDSIPTWAKGKLGVDLSNSLNSESQYMRLLKSLKKPI